MNNLIQYIQFNFGGPDVCGSRILTTTNNGDLTQKSVIELCLDILLNDIRYFKENTKTDLKNNKKFNLFKKFFNSNKKTQKEICKFYHNIVDNDIEYYVENKKEDGDLFLTFDAVFNSDIYKKEYKNLFNETLNF